MSTTVPRSLLLAQRLAGGSNVASSVYGTVITIAVIGAWYADPTSGALETLLSVLATLIVFWIAHAYSHVVGSGWIHTHVFSAAKHDWPIVQSGFFPVLILGAGALGFLDERRALLQAIVSSVVLLALLSMTMARAAGLSWRQALGVTCVMTALGGFIAVLEIALG